MNEHSTLQPGDRVVALSSLACSVGIVSALAAAISYLVVYAVPDVFTILIVLVPALTIGLFVGWLASMRYVTGCNTTIVKHGRAGVPATIRAALAVAAAIAIIFILVVKLGIGFDGSLFGLIATITIPAIAIASGWALLASLA